MEVTKISLFLCPVLLLTGSAAKASSPFFLFGDSFLDSGNNNYIKTTTFMQANFYPYGISFFRNSTGRFSDGRLINDFLAEYANLPLIPPFLQPGQTQYLNGSNFASSGGGALSQTYPGLVIDLHTQVTYYKKVEEWFISEFGQAEARERLGKAVYMVSVGTNDYTSFFLGLNPLGFTYSQSQYVNMVVGNIISVITEIYNTGARKFVFLNVPPIGCMPVLRLLTLVGKCHIKALSYTREHNEVLLQALGKLEKELPGFKFSLYDFYTAIQQRIDTPSKYGYTEEKMACCGSGPFRGVFSCGGTRPLLIEYELCKDIEKHVWWDSIHFTEKTYNQIAEEMWTNENTSLFHGLYTVKDLFQMP